MRQNIKPKTGPDTVNHEHEPSYSTPAEMELYLYCVTSMMKEDKFYSNETDEHNRFMRLVGEVHPTFLLSLANYVRNAMYLRSISIALLVEGAVRMARLADNKYSGTVRAYVPKVVKRADEMAETIAYYQSAYGMEVSGHNGMKMKKAAKLPSALKRGIADTAHSFDEYQLAKWNKGSALVSLRDVMCLTHPKPRNKEESELFKRAVTGQLATPRTWETYISEHGSTAETWNAIAPDMPIMATLRNLRNFEQKQAEEAIKIAINKLTNEKIIRGSKQLPFRWMSADKQISDTRLKDAVRTAMELSVINIPKIDDDVLVAVDVSGSMTMPVSGKSSVYAIDIACTLGALSLYMVQEGRRAAVVAFGDRCVPIPISRKDSILTNTQRINHEGQAAGWSTLASKVPQYLREHKLSFGRIILLSDMQVYSLESGAHEEADSLEKEFKTYRKEINQNCHMFSVDLCGYGTTPFHPMDRNVHLIGGWSEKIFDYMDALNNPAPLDEIAKNW